MLLPKRSVTLVVRAASEPTSSQDEEAQKEAAQAMQDRAFPKTGLFSIADPNAEVYSKAGEAFDPQKKGGRWKPEFIWNTNWQEQLKRQEDLERQQAEYRKKQRAGGITGGTGPGVVSFSRLGTLDDMNVDLTEQLLKAKQKQQQQQAAAAAAAAAAPSTTSSSKQQPAKQQQQPRQRSGAAAASPSYQFKDLPSKNEARRFKRSSRLAAPGTVASINAVGAMSPEEAAQRAAVAAAEKARYEKLKVEFQAWCIGLGLLGTVSCYFLYTRDVAISYALGAVSGLTYLRLLSRTVDSVGGAAGNAAVGQPRLLIPVVLALLYNRWNLLYADEYGITLQLYALLVGFFTYKLAVLGRQGLELLSELSEPEKRAAASESAAEAGDGQGDDSAMSLDRIFIRKALSE